MCNVTSLPFLLVCHGCDVDGNVSGKTEGRYVQLTISYLLADNLEDMEEKNSDGPALDTDNGDIFSWIAQHMDSDIDK